MSLIDYNYINVFGGYPCNKYHYLVLTVNNLKVIDIIYLYPILRETVIFIINHIFLFIIYHKQKTYTPSPNSSSSTSSSITAPT